VPPAADYEDRIRSEVADAEDAGGTPGAVTAALFLQHFTGDVPWAHLDVASIGDAPGDWAEWTAGPTGFGSRVLLHWLENDPLGGIR
jgi:leucyl aminopeptidase